jgi:hypothetical protein
LSLFFAPRSVAPLCRRETAAQERFYFDLKLPLRHSGKVRFAPWVGVAGEEAFQRFFCLVHRSRHGELVAEGFGHDQGLGFFHQVYGLG